jgi:two-component system, LytTR family, response regulator
MNAEDFTTLIVEDDPVALEALKVQLEHYKELKVTGCAVNASEAYGLALEENPELIFLDIELPGKSGIEFLDLILKEGLHPTVIFTTAYQDYAIEAIRHAAFDYLLKPIDPEELAMAISKLKLQRSRQHFEEDLQKLVARLRSPRSLKFNSRKGFVMIDPGDIVYCEADWNYTRIFYGDNDEELVTMNLGKVSELIPGERFIRISRSILININYLTRVEKKQHLIFLKKNNREYSIKVSTLNLRKLENVIGRIAAGNR